MDKPIKKRLLIHSIMQEKYFNSDFGDAWSNPQEIKRVRVEPKSKLTRSTTGDTITSSSIIFVDAFYSTKTQWNEKDRITFKGQTLTVQEVKVFNHGNSDKVHHWELYCL